MPSGLKPRRGRLSVKSLPPNDQSDVEQDQAEENSVFDFLYYDAGRISAFLSQFDASGALTQIVTSERAHRSRKNATSSQASGSLGVLKGGLVDGTDTIAEYGQQSNRTYDTRWANALAFLDYAEQQSLLKRNLAGAGMGEFVLFSGNLAVFDLGILQKVWDKPGIKKTIIAGAKAHPPQSQEGGEKLNRAQRRRLSMANRANGKPESEAELAIELLSVLPHSIQAAVSDEDDSVWCTLREDSLTVSPGDLMLKHGLSIGYDWNIVGILDAAPDINTSMSDGTPFEVAKQMVAGSTLGSLALLLGPQLIPAVRVMLGRPADAYGITPLLIFRSIAPVP